MFPMIPDVFRVNLVGSIHRELSRDPDQGEVIGDREAAKIKQGVVIWA